LTSIVSSAQKLDCETFRIRIIANNAFITARVFELLAGSSIGIVEIDDVTGGRC
jgi:hypothetical protein